MFQNPLASLGLFGQQAGAFMGVGNNSPTEALATNALQNSKEDTALGLKLQELNQSTMQATMKAKAHNKVSEQANTLANNVNF